MWELPREVGLYTNSGLEELQAHPRHKGFEVPLEAKSTTPDKEERFPLSIEVHTRLHVISNFILLQLTPLTTAHPLPLAFAVPGLTYFYFVF